MTESENNTKITYGNYSLYVTKRLNTSSRKMQDSKTQTELLEMKNYNVQRENSLDEMNSHSGNIEDRGT